MKHILITGGLGFIGSHLAIKLLNVGFQITVIDNLSRPSPNLKPKYRNNLYNKEYLRTMYPQIQQKIFDLCDYELLEQEVHKIQPNIIIHAAGQTSAVESIRNPRKDFVHNLFGTINILESLSKISNFDLLIFISSNKIYGENPYPKLASNFSEMQAIDETIRNIHQIRSPYGTAKLCAEHYIHEYAKIKNFHAVIFRLSCIYGYRQFGYEEQGWVAHFITQALRSKPITIYGNGKQIRDILFIDDLTSLFELFLKKFYQEHPRWFKSKSKPLIYNIGGGKENIISLLTLIKKIKKNIKQSIQIEYKPSRMADQTMFFSNIQKIKKQIEWKPNHSIDQGVKATIKWIQKHQDLYIK
jgi:CDP-paratose 2-epimerase